MERAVRKSALVKVMAMIGVGFGLLFAVPAEPAAADNEDVGTAFTYQGRLIRNGEPINDPVNLEFRLFDAQTGGDQVGPTLEAPGFDQIADGLFTIDLDFGPGVLTGEERWLEITINGAVLNPRHPIMPAPYAVLASSVSNIPPKAMTGEFTAPITFTNANVTGSVTGSGAGLTNLNAASITSGTIADELLSGTYTNALTFTDANVTGTFTGSGIGLTSLNASNLALGNVPAARLPIGGSWVLSTPLGIMNANVGIGTNSPEATLHVAEGDSGMGVILPGLRVEQQSVWTHNVIGGHRDNEVAPNVVGATISGGGILIPDELDGVNRVTGNYGSIGGGLGNEASGSATVGGGYINTAGGAESTVGGGQSNTASGNGSTIGGGWGNTTNSEYSTIAGGWNNTASSQRSTIGGGQSNTASGNWSTIPGGRFNEAAGDYSFAAGWRAKAMHDGTFVWADSEDEEFASTGPDQFLIRAAGGVGIGRKSPKAMLDVRSESGPAVNVESTDGTSEGIRVVHFAPNAIAVAVLGGSINGDPVAVRGETDTKIGWAGYFLGPGHFSQAVGIGTTNPGTFKLAVDGSAAKPGGGSWSNFSDARLKRDIQLIEAGMLDRLLSLNGYTFHYTDETIESRFGLPGEQIGLIAQEVQRVFPDWVGEDDDGYLHVTERSVTAIMVEALRELRAEKDAEIAALTSEVDVLHERLAQMEAMLLHFLDEDDAR